MALTVQPVLNYPYWTGVNTDPGTSTFAVNATNYPATSLYGGSVGWTAIGNPTYPALPTTYKGNGIQLVNTTSTAILLAGFIDGENRAKLFYTDGSTISLPTVATVILNLYWNGAFGVSTAGYMFGPVKLIVTYATGSTDAASPSQFVLDQNTMLIVASTAYG